MPRKIVRTSASLIDQRRLPFEIIDLRWSDFGAIMGLDQNAFQSAYLGLPRTYGEVTRSDESNGWVNPMRGPIRGGALTPVHIDQMIGRATRGSHQVSFQGGRRNGRTTHMQLEAYRQLVARDLERASSVYVRRSEQRRYIPPVEAEAIRTGVSELCRCGPHERIVVEEVYADGGIQICIRTEAHMERVPVRRSGIEYVCDASMPINQIRMIADNPRRLGVITNLEPEEQKPNDD